MDAALDAASVQALRREIYAQPAVTRADLTKLLAIGRKAGAAAPKEFDDLFADVATDLLVNQVDPPKYVTKNDADWLVATLQSGGGLGCRAEFDMLLAVLRTAVSIPQSLAGFVVGEIEKAIILGHQASGVGDHPQGIVTHDDVEALNSAVFAAAEGSSLHVTRESAEALFRIAHATAGANNDPAFEGFFARAIGNYLMGVAFRWTPSVDEERAKEKWLDQPAPSLGSFLEGMLHIGKSAAQRASDAEARKPKAENDADRDEIAEKSDIGALDGAWVLDHLTREGPLAPAEKKLLLFLKEDAHSLPPALQKAIDAQAA
ncbi:MAG TPA: hypothetical protein VKS78_10010 [Roseiarcus sp.]|nr:hypothetical protein [Roseiarcus sp.]